jgi:hypothetical protein
MNRSLRNSMSIIYSINIDEYVNQIKKKKKRLLLIKMPKMLAVKDMGFDHVTNMSFCQLFCLILTVDVFG